VWGPKDNNQPIYIDGDELCVIANHVALSHLRFCIVERIMWIDAIYINQEDDDEKERQVQSMAKIYAKASRVIVWLGTAAANSDDAIKEILSSAN